MNTYGTNLCLRSKHWGSCQKYFHIQRNNSKEYWKQYRLERRLIHQEHSILWLTQHTLVQRKQDSGEYLSFEINTTKRTFGGSSLLKKKYITTKKERSTSFPWGIPYSQWPVTVLVAYLSFFLPYPCSSVIFIKLKLWGDTQPSIQRLKQVMNSLN